MDGWKQRIRYAAVTTALVVTTYAVVYQWSMAVFEGESVTLLQSAQVVMEAITTSGFGGHAPWSHPVLNLIVLLMNLTGVLLVFLAVPVFVVPLFREVFQTHPPIETGQTNHVIICRHTPRGDALAKVLADHDREYVFIEPDRETAISLHEAGVNVIAGDPESARTLERANLEAAAGVVADAADDTNASIALTVREMRPDVRVVTLVEDPSLADYHRLAGADAVLSPRQLIGRSLARQVPTVTTTLIDDEVDIGADVEFAEVNVIPHGPLAGREIRESRLREEYGYDAVGVWTGQQFNSPVDTSLTLRPGMRLLVAGPPERLEALRDSLDSTVHPFSTRSVLVAGYGRAGQSAASMLSGTGMSVTVLDRERLDAVDVVGDVRDVDTLKSAGVEDATAAIITVNDDTTAVFATLIMRELNPNLYLIVRANRVDSKTKLARAGADHVQSLAAISGQMMAETLLDDVQDLLPGAQVRIVHRPVGQLAGHTLAEADVREVTGATVLAVTRADTLYTNPDPHAFHLTAGDKVLIAGTEVSVQQFESRYLSDEDLSGTAPPISAPS